MSAKWAGSWRVWPEVEPGVKEVVVAGREAGDAVELLVGQTRTGSFLEDGSPESVVGFLNGFPGEGGGDFHQLDEVIRLAMSLPQSHEVDDALFGIFEGFPAEDGHGVYWSIVHGLEARGEYEQRLLASLRKAPSDFALTMLNRMCNAGVSTCAGVPNLELLQEVAGSFQVQESVRESARNFLNYQRDRRARLRGRRGTAAQPGVADGLPAPSQARSLGRR